MPTIGEQLRTARHERQQSLEDVVRATKVKLDVLERLEADEFTELGAPMYVKGFLKLYATHLGLDATALGEEYLRSQGGLRRQGLQLETEATLRQRRTRDFTLPVDLIVKFIAIATLVFVLAMAVRLVWRWRTSRHQQPAPAAPVLPNANVDPFYHPKKPVPAETLDAAGK
jgi:cytoskeletal protein RodZ